MQHRVAAPIPVVRAMITFAVNEAMVALLRGAMARPGDCLLARRGPFVLPGDVRYEAPRALLLISQPKTRDSGARHQSARITDVTIAQLLDVVVAAAPREELLHLGVQGRIADAAARSWVAGKNQKKKTPYVGPLRAGATTHLLALADNAERTRSRGRWLQNRILATHMQEEPSACFSPSRRK